MEEGVTEASNRQIFRKSLESLESGLSDSKDTVEDSVVSFTELEKYDNQWQIIHLITTGFQRTKKALAPSPSPGR